MIDSVNTRLKIENRIGAIAVVEDKRIAAAATTEVIANKDVISRDAYAD